MPIAAKPYTVTWPFSAGTATECDQMFDLLFTQLRVSAIGEGNAATLVFPTFTKGSIFHISDTIGTVAGLALGGAGTMLRSDAALPNWSVTTWPNSAVTGDIIYASATNAYGNLAGVATGNALLSGGVGVAPVWGDLDLTTTVTGILPVINGGTGLNTITLGRIIIGNGTGVPTLLQPGTTGVVLRGNSSSAWNVSTWTIVNAFPQGSIPYASTQDVLQALLVGAAGTVLVGGATIPSYTATPTITTSLTTPLIIGGTAVGSTLTLKSTTGVGVNDAIIGLIGNNGNVEVMRLDSTNAKFTSVFFDTALGTHGFLSNGTGANILTISNATAGTGNSAGLTIGTDAINNFIITGYSSTFTPSGYAFANGGALANSGDGGLSFAQTGAGDIRFYTTGSQLLRMTIATGGTISTTGSFRSNNATIGTLSTKSGTTFASGFAVQSAALDSFLEIIYDGTNFKISATYQTSEGYKPMAFYTSEALQLVLKTDGMLAFKGTSSSFPALKRATVDLQCRLADDSAYADFDAKGYKAGGVAGVSFGPGMPTTITVVNGIVTAIA